MQTLDFAPTAKQLFHERVLVIKGVQYELCELEFYLHSEQHPDSTVHCHADQKQFGCWYFHRASLKPEAAYKGGSFKGLDLTLSDGSAYYSVLIRSIYSPTTGVISGPCKVVNHILEAYEAKSLSDFTDEQLLSVSENKHAFILLVANVDASEPVYQGPRIGLKADNPWSQQPYRFVRRYKGVKHDKKSLVQLRT